VDPDGLLLYLDSRMNAGFAELERSQAYDVLKKIAAALRFLGFRVVTEGEMPQDKREKNA